VRRVIALAAALGWASPAIGDDGHAVDLPKGTQTKSDGLSGRAAARAQRLRAFAFDWQGTPYLWGGNTKHGTDCSGYLREMFRRIYDLELPRTTRDQIQVGVPVSIEPRNLGRGFQPGDLFFYVDRTGTPNHVVTYIGNGQFTHSASGRGVVVEGFKALWGRRIVGRRVLVPASRAEGYALGPIEAAGPIDAQEIPCPPSIRALPHEVRRYRLEALGDLKSLGSREICEWRALKTALEAQPGPASTRNAQRIDAQIEWLESIEALKEQISLE
jgi:hypothetical protein